MKYQRYDIALALFSFTDLTDAKKRPVVIIKDLEGSNVIACQITTKRHLFEKYLIPLQKDQCIGDIRFDSFICVDLITTLHRSLVFKKIGSIKDEKVKTELDTKLKETLVS